MTKLTKKQHLALFSYRILLMLLAPIILVLLLWRSTSNKAYRSRLLERFGLLTGTFKKHGIIIHAASVGEVFALKNLVEKLLIQYPKTPITFTTFTPTGSEQVSKLFGDRVQHCYLPLDFMFATALFLKTLQPKQIIFMETELWPNLVRQAKNKNIKLLLINGRLSASSMKSYGKVSALISPCIQQFDYILTQSEENQQNFLALGANVQQCEVSGNLKYDMSMNDNTVKITEVLSSYLPTNKKIWVMASTHQGDEELALASYKDLRKKHSELLLVIVPRHPERFSLVADLATKEGFITQKRSSNTNVDKNCEVWVLDSLGELMALYGLADFITIGGSFSNIGGHNPLEPAWFKKPIIVGPKMHNFNDIMSQMLNNNALVQLNDTENISIQLTHVLTKWLADGVKNKEETQLLGEKAYQVVKNNEGAVEVTLHKIISLFT